MTLLCEELFPGRCQLRFLLAIYLRIRQFQTLECVYYRGSHHQSCEPLIVGGHEYQGACSVAVCRIISS